MIPELLTFLYASMPLPDSVDYSRDFWLDNIQCSLQARAEMPWGSIIPDREWRHFVLPVRVNNENLDRSRMVFYEELRPRVEGLSMTDAILEVNHWCHEHVTYTPSDERTSSPLATIRTAHGRCGEESTLLVAALRSIGIPARQVYTPRWAHTDDNHAWVEAWADGQWHFLGACEPEPVLNLGWFNAPASRAMLMHTKVFGHDYDGPEEVMQRTHCYIEIDVTANYAPVARSYVRVVDAQGMAVADADVEFKIYNYAEFYTVATHNTDACGIASMQAGLGDLIAWAHKGTSYGFERIHIGSTDTLTIVLDHHPGQTYSCDLTVVSPVGSKALPYVAPEQRKANDLRLAYEDSLRNAYVATFPSHEAIQAYIDSLYWDKSLSYSTFGPLPTERTSKLITASRGNYATLMQYLADEQVSHMASFALPLLENLTAKDLRDVPLDVLRDHTTWSFLPAIHYDGQCPDSIFHTYIASPRIANERLTPFRSELFEDMGARSPEEIEACFIQHWQQGPEALVRWTSDSIRIDLTSNPQRLCMSPLGVYRHRVTDAHSRDIFFVALARTFGFPARIDPVTGKIQYYLLTEGRWHDVTFAPTAASAAAITPSAAPTTPSATAASAATITPSAAATTAPSAAAIIPSAVATAASAAATASAATIVPSAVATITPSAAAAVPVPEGSPSGLTPQPLQPALTPQPAAAPSLLLTYAPTRYLLDPKYFTHFTLSRIQNGTATLLNYREEDTWQSLFAQGPQSLDTGDYLLTTGTRMADGSVLVHTEIFPVGSTQSTEASATTTKPLATAQALTTTKPLTMRQAETGLQVIGSFNSENLYHDLQAGQKSLLSTTGRGYYVLGLIASGQEPTNHALRDIARCREQIEQWGGHLVLLFRDEADAQRFQSADFPALPADTHFGTDIDGRITAELCQEMHIEPTALPIFIIADTFNRIVFLSNGYTIGLGDQLVTNLMSLE